MEEYYRLKSGLIRTLYEKVEALEKEIKALKEPRLGELTSETFRCHNCLKCNKKISLCEGCMRLGGEVREQELDLPGGQDIMFTDKYGVKYTRGINIDVLCRECSPEERFLYSSMSDEQMLEDQRKRNKENPDRFPLEEKYYHPFDVSIK